MKKLRTLFTAGLALICAAALCLSLVALSDWTFTGRLDALPGARADVTMAASSPLPTEQGDAADATTVAPSPIPADQDSAADAVPLETDGAALDASSTLLPVSPSPAPADAADAMRIVSGLAGASHTAEPPAYLLRDQLFFYAASSTTITRTGEEWQTAEGTLLDDQEAGDASRFVTRAANLCAALLEMESLPETYVCQAAWDGTSVLKCVWYPQDLSLREAQGEAAPLRYTLYVHTDESTVEAVMDNFVAPQESLPQALQEDIAEQLKCTELTGAWEITQVAADGTGAVRYTVKDQAQPEIVRTVNYQRNESTDQYSSDTQELLSYYRALADRGVLISTASGSKNITYVNLRLLMDALLTEANVPLTTGQDADGEDAIYRTAPLTRALSIDDEAGRLPYAGDVTDDIISDLEFKARLLFYHAANFYPVVQDADFSMELHTAEEQIQVFCRWGAFKTGVVCTLSCTLPNVQEGVSDIPADMTVSVDFPSLPVEEIANDTLSLLLSGAMENLVGSDNGMNSVLLAYKSGALQLEGIVLSLKEGSVSATVTYDDKDGKTSVVIPLAAADFNDYQIAFMAYQLVQAIMTPAR